MIKERAGNPLHRYGARSSVDPSSQTEDLGDDAIKASMYGIANLKRIVPNLVKWSSEEGKDYSNLNELYGQVMGQLGRYMGHVSTNVGGVYQDNKTADQDGFVFTTVPANHQRAAVQFLNDQLFTTPRWLIDSDILRRIESNGMMDRLRRLQVQTLNRLFNADRLKRLSENEALDGPNSYTITELFSDVRQGIWSDLQSRRAIDPFRRNLQRAFLNKMTELLDAKESNYDQSDARAVARGTLEQLKKDLEKAIKRQGDDLSKYHLQDALSRVERVLEPTNK